MRRDRGIPPAPPSCQRSCRAAFLLALLGLFVPGPGFALTDDELRRDAVVRAVERARPTVVNVNTEEEVAVSLFAAGGDQIFDRFFRDFFETAPRRKVTSRSLGSGVIFDPRGYILTNEHVVARASRISVTLADERTFPAKLVGTDPDHDLAVIKVEAKESFPSIQTGDSDRLLIGERVIAIGLPALRVAAGGPAARAGVEEGDLVLSVGGAAVRSAGEFHYQVGRHAPGETVFLAVRRGKTVLDLSVGAEQFSAKVAGTIAWDWLGLSLKSSRAGIAVSRVRKGGAADEIGLEPGDLILQVGGEEVSTDEEFAHGVMLAFQRGAFPMLVQRGRRGYFITLPIKGTRT